jgi:hypothetical protein
VQDAYIFELVAGFLYLVLGVRLLVLASRTARSPERLLGAISVLTGLSYAYYELPHFFAEIPVIEAPYALAGRVLFDLGVVLLAWLCRQVFHPGRGWAIAAVAGSAIALALAISASLFEGDLLGYAPLGSWGFWVEWVVQALVPMWLAIEAFVACARMRRYRALQLGDPLAGHRHLMWGVFGIAQVACTFVVVPMYVEFQTLNFFTPFMDSLLGACECISVAALWLAFFPPAPWRDWIERAAARSAGRS